jgi:hypothetical protein
MCAGTGKVVCRPGDGEEPPPSPYYPAISPEEYERAWLQVSGCWHWDCDEGYRHLPYQQFKFDFAVGWARKADGPARHLAVARPARRSGASR